jgi:hypothetical protein
MLAWTPVPLFQDVITFARYTGLIWARHDEIEDWSMSALPDMTDNQTMKEITDVAIRPMAIILTKCCKFSGGFHVRKMYQVDLFRSKSLRMQQAYQECQPYLAVSTL